MWRDSYPFSFWVMRPSRILENMMDKEFAEPEDMLNRMFRTVREINPSDLANNTLYYYGYQVTIGPDGKPHVREFGNIRPSAKGLIEQTGVRAPLVDTAVDEKQNTLRITAEMPGVNKEDIKVNVSDKYVTIHAEKGDKKYHTDIPVDVELDDSASSSAKATYTNGILELNIKLKQAPKEKAKEIKVE
ncbi:MAG: archaeal heat shock protein Hsp20 [Nitrososphaeraceae archaeon]